MSEPTEDRFSVSAARALIVFTALVVAAVAVIAGLKLANRDTSPPAPAGAVAVFPAGGSADAATGVRVGAGGATVDIYEDFQCPACAAAEKVLADPISAQVDAGRNTVVLHPMVFLDAKLGNDSSLRAANAFGCAADQGRALDFHKALFAAQPAREGDGYTDAALHGAAAAAGVPDLAAFDACAASGRYNAWAQASDAAAKSRGVTSTPTFLLAGAPLRLSDYTSVDGLMAALSAATPSPAPVG